MCNVQIEAQGGTDKQKCKGIWDTCKSPLFHCYSATVLHSEQLFQINGFILKIPTHLILRFVSFKEKVPTPTPSKRTFISNGSKVT